VRTGRAQYGSYHMVGTLCGFRMRGTYAIPWVILALAIALPQVAGATRSPTPTSANAALPSPPASARRLPAPSSASAAQPHPSAPTSAAQSSPPASASTAPSVSLRAALRPEHLGQGTTIEFGFTVTTHNGQPPSPLTAIDLYYPANLGLATSGLGLETCTASILDIVGPEGCPSQSRMGYGTATVEVPFGPLLLHEAATTAIFMAPLHQGRLGLLFFAAGSNPVAAEIVFPGLVLPAHDPFGGDLATTVPLVPTLPGAPNAALVKLTTTIGPLGIIYYERAHNQYLPYHPKGIVLPHTCPHGGFQFAAYLSFEDGGHAEAHTAVACPAG
jgi:hypothetical protein